MRNAPINVIPLAASRVTCPVSGQERGIQSFVICTEYRYTILFTMNMSLPHSKRGHRTQKGFEKCPHQCNPTGCLSGYMSRLWPREGHSVLRHLRSLHQHPKCTSRCPAHLGLTPRANITPLKTSISVSIEEVQEELRCNNLMPDSLREKMLNYLADEKVH